MKERGGRREKETEKAGNRKRGRNDSENQRAMRLSLIPDAGGNDS